MAKDNAEPPVSSTKRDPSVVPASAQAASAQGPVQRPSKKKRVIGKEGEVRTPFADAAVTTRSTRSSAG